MSKTKELRDMRDGCAALARKHHNESKSILGRATTAGRDLTPSEQGQINDLVRRGDEHMAELAKIDAELVHAEREEAEPVYNGPVGRVVPPAPIGSRHGAGASGFAAPKREFGAMFKNAHDPYGGAFSGLGDFAKAVAVGHDARLIRNASSVGSTTSEGASAGFLVPSAFVSQMMDASLLQEVFRPRANVVPVSSGTSIVAGFSSTDGTGSKRAGLQMLWEQEASDLTQQKPKAVEMTAHARKAAIFCVISTELMDDAPNFDAMLSQAMTAAVAAGLDYAFINGTGAGMPLGVINGPSTITVAKESAQAANTLMLQNLANMVGRLLPASFARSVWFVHPTLVPLLYGMAYTVKNVAGTENVGGGHVQAVGHDAAGNLTIFGRPALVTDACSVLSAKGDIVLCDPMRYLITMRSDVRLARDASAYFSSDQVGFRLTLRLDGTPEGSEPTKLRDGTNTVSPFVTLAAR